MLSYDTRRKPHPPGCECSVCRSRRKPAAPVWECEAGAPCDCGPVNCRPVHDPCAEITCDRRPPCPPPPMPPCPPPKPPRPAPPPCPPPRPRPYPPEQDTCRKSFPPHGFLLPRIIASGREWLRRQCVSLTVCGLPPCAQPPFMLVGVQQSCEEVRWEVLPGCTSHQLMLHLILPVDCQVRDAAGCMYTGHATVELDAALRLSCPLGECWRNQLDVFPCIRLVSMTPACDTPTFEATLEILAELYMTRWEPCMAGVPKPVCPELPLYPQPRCDG